MHRAPRVIHLSLDPLQIYWVGKGGKRKWINLNDVVFLRCGVFISNTNVCVLVIALNNSNFKSQFSYPAEGFKKSGVPSNCECYVSMGMNEDDRESLDVEFSSPDHARLFASVMESILPNLVGKEAKA